MRDGAWSYEMRWAQFQMGTRWAGIHRRGWPRGYTRRVCVLLSLLKGYVCAWSFGSFELSAASCILFAYSAAYYLFCLMMRVLLRLLVPLLFSILLACAAADQKCYALNGTELDSTYAPCDPSAKHSGCCALRRPAGSVDICLSNGLCMATDDKYMGTIWQDGCTDPTGKDDRCPKMCPDGIVGPSPRNSERPR